MTKTISQIIEEVRKEGYLPTISEDASSVFLALRDKKITSSHLPQSNAGLQYLDGIFSHRFKSSSAGCKSLHEAFNDDSEMKKVIGYIFDTGREPTRDLILRNLKFNIHAPSHFFPSAAASLCNHFASGGDVYDVFTGWGGRALGSICSGVSYLVSTDTQFASTCAGKYVANDLSGMSKTKSEFFNVDFKEYAKSTDKKFDLIMASPPFLDTENYGDGNDRTVRQWVTDIAIPLAKYGLLLLKPGGFVAVHGQDRPSAPVLSMLYTAFSCVGFKISSEFKYGKKAGQSVIVFNRDDVL